MGDGVKRRASPILVVAGDTARLPMEGNMRLTILAVYRTTAATVLEASLATAALFSIFHVF